MPAQCAVAAAARAATLQGDVQQLEQLLAAHGRHAVATSIDECDLPSTLLSIAVVHSQVATAAVLLRWGAKSVSTDGVCDLNCAAELGCVPMVHMLVEAGANMACAIVAKAANAAQQVQGLAKAAADASAPHESAGAAVAELAGAASSAPTAPLGTSSSAPTASAEGLSPATTAPAPAAAPEICAGMACHAPAIAALRLLLKAAGGIDTPMSTGALLEPLCTPLMLAAAQGEEGAVRLLLQEGAAVNAAVAGVTAAGWAARRGQAATLTKLLAAGAVPTAMDVLSTAKTGPERLLQQLLDAGASAAVACHPLGQTAVMFAADRGFCAQTVQQLLAAGCSVDWEQKNGFTALHRAAAAGHINTVKALLAAGADATAVSKEGSSVLGAAVERVIVWCSCGSLGLGPDWFNRHRQTAQVLTVHGADINSATVENSNLLCHAVSQGALQAVRLLLELGADANSPGLDGRQPLDLAVRDPLQFSMQPERIVDTVKALLAAGASTCQVGNKPSPPAAAACNGDVEMVRLLIAAGAPVNVASAWVAESNGLEHDPLIAAAVEGHVGVVQELLKAGAKCHNSLGVNLALNMAVLLGSAGHVHVMRELLGSTSNALTAQDALRALRKSLGRIQPRYDLSALLQLYIYKQVQAGRGTVGEPGGAAHTFHALAAVAKEVEHASLEPGFDRVALSMALLRSWCGDTAGVTEGQDAAAAMERGTAAVRADAREALVQLAEAGRVGR